MAKMVKFRLLDNQDVFLNSETIRAIKPQAGNSLVVYGDSPNDGVVVQGNPQTIASKLIG